MLNTQPVVTCVTTILRQEIPEDMVSSKCVVVCTRGQTDYCQNKTSVRKRRFVCQPSPTVAWKCLCTFMVAPFVCIRWDITTKIKKKMPVRVVMLVSLLSQLEQLRAHNTHTCYTVVKAGKRGLFREHNKYTEKHSAMWCTANLDKIKTNQSQHGSGPSRILAESTLQITHRYLIYNSRN